MPDGVHDLKKLRLDDCTPYHVGISACYFPYLHNEEIDIEKLMFCSKVVAQFLHPNPVLDLNMNGGNMTFGTQGSMNAILRYCIGEKRDKRAITPTLIQPL